MKAVNIIHPVIGLCIIFFLASCLALAPRPAGAQENGYPASGDPADGYQESDGPEPAAIYSREELVQMLAPIALYPDVLLSQILMASTYPIEVIEADRWVKRNPGFEGEALDNALLVEDWDPSVKAVSHFPNILALMSERITETTNLGNAFLAQEDEVLDVVQELRANAYAHGNLTTTSEQKVIVEKQTIIIQPANPRVIYVPYYDSFNIYGPWRYPAYPPYYWGPPGVTVGFGISYWPGFHFGFAFGSWSYFDWHTRVIFIDVHQRPRFVRHERWIVDSGRWYHAPRHRRGAAYRDKYTARKYGQYPGRVREFRRDTRGFPEGRSPEVERRGTDRTRIDREPRREERTIIDRDRRESERVERDPRIRQRAEQEKRSERVEPGRPPSSRGTLFNRVEDGRRERESSERGQSSRQGRESEARGRGDRDRDQDRSRSGRGDRDGGGDRGRDRR